MSQTINLGSVTAYASAVEGGYTGTYSDFCTDLVNSAELADSIRTDTMPTASSSNVGDIVQFIGTTTSSYTHGYFYECQESGGSYSWVNLPVSEGGGGGHIIKNSSGTTMTQREALKFSGASVTDDSSNDQTVVDVSNASDYTVTFTDASADASITTGSDLKTIVSLIKYKFANLVHGHAIKNSSGTSMTQRSALQFSNGAVTDDSTNDKTVVDVIGTYSEGSQVVSTANQAFNVVISATGLSTSSKILSVCTSVKGLNYTDITIAANQCTLSFPGVANAQTVTAGIVWR